MTSNQISKWWGALILSTSMLGAAAPVSAAPSPPKAADKTNDKAAKAGEKDKAPPQKGADQANDDDADDAAAKAGEKAKSPPRKAADK